MTSSSPPPLVPIHGSDSIYYREENKNPTAANKLNKPIELHLDEFFKGETHECFKITNNASGSGEYHQQQPSYHYESPCHVRPHQLTTQSQIEISKSTRPNLAGSNPLPGADIPADLLFHHDSLKQDETFSRQEIVSDIDCYWYKKNLENVNTIDYLRKEVTELKRKLTSYENNYGTGGEKKTLNERGKFEKKMAALFKCETCRKEYKTERGLEVHRNNRHCQNWMNRQLEIFRTPNPWPHNDVFGNPIVSSRRKSAECQERDRSVLSSKDSYILFHRDGTLPSV